MLYKKRGDSVGGNSGRFIRDIIILLLLLMFDVLITDFIFRIYVYNKWVWGGNWVKKKRHFFLVFI